MSGGAAQPNLSRLRRGAEPRRLAQDRVTIVFLAPAPVLLGVWIVYPTVYTVVRSFYDRDGSEFIGFDNYRDAVLAGHADHGDPEQRRCGSRSCRRS